MRVAALAGRRLSGADGAFPQARIAAVRARIKTALVDARVGRLVCSAADGADLVALEIALEMGIERHVVIPGDMATFRESSVTPGWHARFNRFVAWSTRVPVDGDFRDATRRIVADAAAAAGPGEGFALVVWDGPKLSSHDHTGEFAKLSAAAGLKVTSVPIA